MGLISYIEEVTALTRLELLEKQLAKNKTRGLDDVEASALLILQRWKLPQTPEMLPRTVALAMNLKESKWVIGLLMFTQRIGIQKAMSRSFETDLFFERHGRLYLTAAPLTTFARKYMNQLWDHKHVDPGTVTDTVFAAYYATLIAPFAVDAWLMLAQLKRWDIKVEIDGRDHAKEGIAKANEFLESFPDADPEFRTLLTNGIKHLGQAGKEQVALDAAFIAAKNVLLQHLGTDAQGKTPN